MVLDFVRYRLIFVAPLNLQLVFVTYLDPTIFKWLFKFFENLLSPMHEIDANFERKFKSIQIFLCCRHKIS